MEIEQNARLAKQAAINLAAVCTNYKNNALLNIADQIDKNREAIIAANQTDIAESEKNNLEAPLLKRLKFDSQKIDEVINGLKSLATLPDPVGSTLMGTELDNGLNLYRVSWPIGVIGVIFESRPDALVQIASLCLKSGNAVLLKGGSEAINTNRQLIKIITDATTPWHIPQGWAQLLETRDHVNAMLKLDNFIDLIIPRGSNSFVKYIMDNSNIPVLGHADGICHVYVDETADLEMAVKIVTDSKTQYVSVCNAAETLLVHHSIAASFLPLLDIALEAKDVELRGCPKTLSYIDAVPATEQDWKTEYLDYILSVKIVDNIEQAIDHINQYGSGHTDVIVTDNNKNASQFFKLVDSGNVFHNCSSRFSDGFRYGFGAEVGVSTNKIHARGPVGLEGLMIYKYIIKGNGHIVADYANGTKKFTHKKTDTKFEF